MLTTAILPIMIALNTQLPTSGHIVVAKTVNIFKCAMERRSEYLAGRPRQGPGPEHGGDPNDEQHDYGLPANAHAGDGYPSSDPYNDSTGNNTNHPNKPY